MKMVAAFTLLAVLGAGAAVAADPPATPSATPIKHPSLQTCNKQADAKKLSGRERARFVRECQAGKPS